MHFPATVRADGSAPAVRMSGLLVPGGSVSSSYRLAPDASTIVYLADAAHDGLIELFAAATDPLGKAQRR